MTRTFLKEKKFRLKKKRFWSETEVLTNSSSAKGDSAANRIHPEIHYLPQKGKNQGIRGNHRETRVYTRL